MIAAELPDPRRKADDQRARRSAAQRPGIAFVIPPVINDDGDAALITVIPTTSPQDPATEDLVHRLRDDAHPEQLRRHRGQASRSAA